MSSPVADPATNLKERTILIIGSLNMDLVVRCPHIPVPGETIIGHDFTLTPGGKGANGATAAAALIDREQGWQVALCGAVGDDDNGRRVRRNLTDRGVEITYLRTLDRVPSGVALIAVSDEGENSIVVVSGANAQVQPAWVDAVVAALQPRVVLLQLEIPLETVLESAVRGRAQGALVVLDPAPAPRALPPALLQAVDLLLPNQGELATLSGLPTATDEEIAVAAAALRAQGVDTVVVKCGARGAMVVDTAGARTIPSLAVEVVDTTGAGDCFDGALAVAVAEGQPLDRAVRFATHAAALACTRLGAQSAQPSRAEVERTL